MSEQPNLFPMAHGTGLAGEAGPEGVFPLGAAPAAISGWRAPADRQCTGHEYGTRCSRRARGRDGNDSAGDVNRADRNNRSWAKIRSGGNRMASTRSSAPTASGAWRGHVDGHAPAEPVTRAEPTPGRAQRTNSSCKRSSSYHPSWGLSYFLTSYVKAFDASLETGVLLAFLPGPVSKLKVPRLDGQGNRTCKSASSPTSTGR